MAVVIDMDVKKYTILKQKVIAKDNETGILPFGKFPVGYFKIQIFYGWNQSRPYKGAFEALTNMSYIEENNLWQ